MSATESSGGLGAARLYVISAEGEPEVQASVLCAALEGGADMVQLRNKTAPLRAVFEAARRVAAQARITGRLFIVDDHLDIAMASAAGGVHLGQDDLPVDVARDLWGAGPVIGLSTRSLAQARAARAAGADYIGVGPVFATPTKPGRPAVGLELLSAVAAEIDLPWFAIGGIDSTNLADVVAAGATRVAVVRAVASAPDPRGAAQRLREELDVAVGAAV